MQSVLLVLNAGSGTVKTALFTCEPQPRELRRETAIARDPDAAVVRASSMVRGVTADTSVTAIGHRIVHGGPRYQAPTRIDGDVIEELRRLVPFAPNHLPAWTRRWG